MRSVGLGEGFAKALLSGKEKLSPYAGRTQAHILSVTRLLWTVPRACLIQIFGFRAKNPLVTLK